MSHPDDAPGALYRRHRPKRLGAVVGQDAVAAALANTLREGRVGHAYLFSGPRGTGKTTVARIFAMALNCLAPDGHEPCGECSSCQSIVAGSSMDLVELDAASNNGVDAIRDLTAKAALGTSGNRKVYLIDEAHMLSAAASNALLKTLEEPPAHVVFVLATTDPQNLLATVRSRCQQLEFRLVRPQVLAGHLRTVAAAERLEVTDAQIAEAVRRSGGSVRDALSALDVIVATGAETGRDVAGELIDAVMSLDRLATLRAVAEAAADGIEPRRLAEECVATLRDMFLVQQGAAELTQTADLATLEARARAAGARRTVALADAIGDAIIAMRAGHDARISLEVNLARWIRNETAAAKAA